MDFELLPQAEIPGRIANIPKLRVSRNHRTYFLQILMYLYHDNHARLLATIAFNKMAQKMAKEVQQGDLIDLKTRIDGIRNEDYLNTTLIISDFSFLEPKSIRDIYHGKSGKKLKVLFPVVPSNYHAYKAHTAAKANSRAKAERPAKHTVAKHDTDQTTLTPQVKANAKPKVQKVAVSVVKPKHRADARAARAKTAEARDQGEPFHAADYRDIDDDWVAEANKFSKIQDFPDMTGDDRP